MGVPTRQSKRKQTTLPPDARRKAEKERAKIKYVEPPKIPSTGIMKLITVVSLVLQSIATILAIYSIINQNSIPLFEKDGQTNGLLFLIFPAISWGATIVLRLLCNNRRIDKWGLRDQILLAVYLKEGKPIKMCTLLVELVVAGCILCVNLVYVGLFGTSSIIYILTISMVLLVLAIFLPFLFAVRSMMRQEE